MLNVEHRLPSAQPLTGAVRIRHSRVYTNRNRPAGRTCVGSCDQQIVSARYLPLQRNHQAAHHSLLPFKYVVRSKCPARDAFAGRSRLPIVNPKGPHEPTLIQEQRRNQCAVDTPAEQHAAATTACRRHARMIARFCTWVSYRRATGRESMGLRLLPGRDKAGDLADVEWIG